MQVLVSLCTKVAFYYAAATVVYYAEATVESYAYLWSAMTEKHLNNCLLLHAHKEITDSLNSEDIAKVSVNV